MSRNIFFAIYREILNPKAPTPLFSYTFVPYCRDVYYLLFINRSNTKPYVQYIPLTAVFIPTQLETSLALVTFV